MNDSSISVSSSVNPRSTSRWLTNRRLFVALVLVLSAALLLLDRPTVLHWVCVALALRMLVVMVLVIVVKALGGSASRAAWGAVVGIIVADLPLATLSALVEIGYLQFIIGNPFVVIGAIVGAVSALTNAGRGAIAGILCYGISMGLLYGVLTVSTWMINSASSAQLPKPMMCSGPPVLWGMFALTIVVPVLTLLTLIVVEVLRFVIGRRFHQEPKLATDADGSNTRMHGRLRALRMHALLFLLLSVSVYVGWWTRPTFLSTRTRIAVERLRQIEGRLEGRGPNALFVSYRPGADDASDAQLKQIWSASLYGERLHDDDLLLLKDVPNLHLLAIGGPHVSDVGIAHLKHLPSLTFLQVSNTRLTGTGLKELHGLNNLETLELIKCQIDDAGLANIGALTNLKSLSLEGTPISDSGLSGLKSLTDCTKINLIGTNVGDGAVQFFKDMPNLRIMLVHQSTTSKATWDEVNRIMRQRNKSP